MKLELSDEQTVALERELRDIVESVFLQRRV
jgi:hypothetical protein